MTTVAPPDIRVRRCTVHVRRRGGWGWGDPRAYVDPVVAVIEDALRLAAAEAALPTDVDITVNEPVTLAVAADGSVSPSSLRELVDLLRAASVKSLVPVADSAQIQPIVDAQAASPADAVQVVEPAVVLAALTATLAQWFGAGRIAVLAGAWSAAGLDAWVSALLAASRTTDRPTAGLHPDAVEAIATAVLNSGPAAAVGPDPRVRFLVLTGAIAAALGGRAPDRPTMALIARHAGVAADGPAAPTASGATTAAAATPREASTDVAATAVPPVGPAVLPALPFLVIVQLHRLGYLEPANAALLAAGITAAAASLAAVVAGKVLDPPERGWRRSPDQRLTVERVSGLTPGQIDDAASQWADRRETLLAPLRTALVELYADGRSRHDEVVLTRIEDGILYGEAAGRMPIAWGGSVDELADVLVQLGDPPVLESDVLAPLASALGPRRSLPRHDAAGLERLLGTVVGTALGSLAQELWGEEADALLALDRLRDLEAQVAIRDRVIIAVPRGQRWLDLKRAGLLDAWPAPWAPGGLWELVTW